ncbi:disease resistance protein L6-like [Rhodamnia argentea]|uniref:Disease resistance protein L6-like n=1 Tax=Rhodamnia argentea TaxID=178133 RepID=A0ABM3HX81_9MYRT|nr:disease resistance protein L6-like [Rhodamnia argentea]
MAPATLTSGMKFEVFLSFRGPDTRDNFTSCLYHDMAEKGIRVFKDSEELRVGQKIEGEILQALEDAQIYIPIFSTGFASSAWCLREVAHMVDCTLKSDGKKVILPVFFDVEPDDVKLKTNLYRDALSEHEKKYSSHEVKRWEDALVEVPTKVGWKLEGKGYGELTKLIVRELLVKLKGKNRPLPYHLVETDDLARIEELLDIDSDDHVRFVIIHGTGGIGKSTLASVIFNRFRSKFDCSSFLDDVQSHGLIDMQKKLLSETLGSNSAQEIYDTNDGIDRITRGLGKRKILIVVDNVDEKKQLENLAGSCDWFGCGSRVIITCRDLRTIRNTDNQKRPSNYMDYSVKEMPLDQAIQLFSKHAFRSNPPTKDCYNFSKEVVLSVGKLPLTLEVVGSLFANTVRSEWDETFEDLKQTPYKDVRQSLMISINKLDEIEKAIFIDIACFCIGEDKTYADYMWRSSGYSPHGAIDVLLLMSLIKINEHNRFWMHDEVRDLGRYIVKRDNVEDAGKRTWVWIDENTLDMLRSNEEKQAVRALSVGISHDFTPEELVRLPKLRFLGGERMNFVGDFKNLLRNLKWLSWRHCHLDFSPTNLDLVNLVVLDLSQSRITDDWVGWLQIEMVKKLKVLDLTHCKELTKTPDFSEFSKLEKLILAWCVKLSTIDGSIGKLKLLSTLNIQGCHSLQGLPDEIGSLECLSEIVMPSGVKPFKLFETLGNLKSLTQFEIRLHYGISRLPHSIGRLMNLTKLSFHACKNLYELPDSIGELQSLVELDLQLSGISILPDAIGKLKRLKVIRLGHSKIHTIPCALGGVEMLELLDASFCSYLKGKVPWEWWSLTRLRILDLYRTPISRVPTNLSGFSNLQELKISSHQRHPLLELPSSLKCLVVEAAKFPVLPNLSSLVDLHHLEVCGSRRPMSANEDIWPGKDEDIPQFPVFPDLCGPKNQVSDFLVFKRLEKRGLSAVEYLVRLRELKISSWEFLESTPDLSALKRLQDLHLSGLPKLAEVPGLGKLESLKFLCIGWCNVIPQLPNLWKLKNLQRLKLYYCSMLRTVEGLKELNSLKKVEIQKCMSLERLPDLPAFTKLYTDWMPPKAAKLTVQSTMPRKRSWLSMLLDK